MTSIGGGLLTFGIIATVVANVVDDKTLCTSDSPTEYPKLAIIGRSRSESA